MGQILSIILRFLRCNGSRSKAIDQTPRDHHQDHDHDHDQLKEQFLPVQQQPEESHRIDIIDPQPVSGSITNYTTPYMLLDLTGKDQDFVESVPFDHAEKVIIVVEEKLHKAKRINTSGDGVKRIGPYTSTQSILLEGEGSKAGDQTPRDHYRHHDHDHDQLKEQILPVQQQPAESHRIDIIIDPQPVLGSITGSYNCTRENHTTPCMVLDWSGKDQNHVESVPSDHITDKVLIVVDEKLHKGKRVKISGERLKRIGPYTSTQSILLVGEGDFSFSASLAVAFGSSSNIIATSLNTQDFLNTNYANFPNNKVELVSRGSVVLHGVDATKMAKHPRLRKIKFDRIIYNFPHSGFNGDSRESQISRHQKLVSGFLRNAKKMMEEDGQIHVTHKSNGFFLEWNIPNLGSVLGLNLIQEVNFKRSNYPGYHTKYGFGGDKDFDCTPSKTYKFALPCK